MSGLFGFYGKIPALGDFVRGGNISRSFVKAWDPFLQNGFLNSRKSLGEAWAKTYQTAPIWRFCIGADIIEGGPYTGVLMPSQDSVGRLFPLTIVIGSAPPKDGLNDRGFYYPIEDAALGMLDALRGKADLERAIEKFEAPEISACIDADTTRWLSAPDAGYGAPLGLSHIGLPTGKSFQTLLTQNLECWTGLVSKGAVT